MVMCYLFCFMWLKMLLSYRPDMTRRYNWTGLEKHPSGKWWSSYCYKAFAIKLWNLDVILFFGLS